MTKDAVRMFTARELRIGAHLRKALRGRNQKVFLRPARELRRLRRSRAPRLIAHNPHSRCRWLRAVARRLGAVLGAEPPRYRLARPLYLVTVLDSRQLIDLELPDLDCRENGDGARKSPTWERIRRAYNSSMGIIDYFGMLDFAMIVSARRVFHSNSVVHVHMHALVWNTPEEILEQAKKRAQRTTRALLSYSSVFDYRPVQIEDFLQIVWYINKAPRKQYQVHVKATGRWREYKREINGVNSVRLYKLMRKVTLEDLALAGGEGCEVLRRVLRDARRV